MADDEQKKATIIDGKAIADSIRAEIKKEVEALAKEHKDAPPPGLAVIIVGARPDSQTYVRLKHKAAEECGIRSLQVELPEDVSQEELESKVKMLNDDPTCHGFIVQMPLPKHINTCRVLDLVNPQKDVDGLTPLNVGLLYCKGRDPYFYPCTPQGVINLLQRSGVVLAGARAAVLGRSNIVGLPVSQLLMQQNATVTVCHTGTKDTAEIVRQADIVIAACGQPEIVRGSWIKPGAAIIDVGTNPIPDASKKSGFRLVGDCCFEEVSAVASCVTPVPGGVGPMTIAHLLLNTMIGYKRALAALAMK